MRTIAYVSLVLLPPAFISSIFGMQFFQFDTATRTLIVAKSFWQYWAVTIPVTISVVLIWNAWVWLEKKQSIGDEKSQQLDIEEEDVGTRR
jgi:Mg2+ and Co2+ transporter CorA